MDSLLFSEVDALGSIGAGSCLVDFILCRVACKCLYAVATAFGGWRSTLAAVNPVTLMSEFSIADINFETVGEPNAACQKFTKSSTESNQIAADAE